MKKAFVLLLAAVGLAGACGAAELALSVMSGARLVFTSSAGNSTNVTWTATMRQARTTFPLTSCIDVGTGVVPITYTKASRAKSIVTATAVVTLAPGVKAEVTDLFSVAGKDAFDIARTVVVKRTAAGAEPAFFSTFGVGTGPYTFASVEPFVPSAMYRSMFDVRANPSAIALKPNAGMFSFREDRLPLPIIAFRDKKSGWSMSLTLHDTGCATTLADAAGQPTDPGYKFGGVGLVRDGQTDAMTLYASYPGDDRHDGGLGIRRHPSANGQYDEYRVRLRMARDASYGAMVEHTWRSGVELYKPKVRAVDLNAARAAILKTLFDYRQSPAGQNLTQTRGQAPGFPWSVHLTGDFKVMGNTYEIGFTGAQPVAGYALMQAGVLDKDEGWRKHGEGVIDFWAKEGLTDLGLPKARYYPVPGAWDQWHGPEVTLRQTSTGMCAIFDAWQFLKKQGEDRPAWIAACQKYGEWLVKNQAADGSWAMSYEPFKKAEGKHPVAKPNKALTVCAIPLLARLAQEAGEKGDPRWRKAALKAGEFAWKFNHEDYLYVACCIDNPQVLDSESGYEAMKAFLSLYALDGRKKWLTAAHQAATYAETWTYMHEVPPERDAKAGTDWPFDRSVVGQHILTVNQPAADLGFAWTAFEFEQLARLERDTHFRLMAKIALHNTKQSMNLGQKIYPNRPEGLQLEASNLRTALNVPRRTHCVTQALTWNFAAHLLPLAQFMETKDAAIPEKLLR